MKAILGLLAAGLVVASTGGALAAPPPGFTPHFSFGFGFGPSYPEYHRFHYRDYSDCLSRRELFSSLADDGYYRARVVGRLPGRLIIRAVNDGDLFRLIVDRCSGDILSEHPIYY